MVLLWVETVKILAKQIEEIYGSFPQEITPLTLNGLLSEWVEIKNMMRNLSAVCLLWTLLRNLLLLTAVTMFLSRWKLGLHLLIQTFWDWLNYTCVYQSAVWTARFFRLQ